MATIRVLPPELASQIAAGEVAERPSSVVKELIENALDAGASRCDVEIEGGGITRLAVADDGVGMSAEDARLAFERHATSKLTSSDELGQIESYGFRGEALPSIASVGRTLLRTRASGSEEGTEVRVVPGSPLSARPAGASPGTRIEVADLFSNVPARRKFLRSSGTESGHVTEVVESAALSRPEVTFTLTRDGRKVREFLRVHTRADRVHQVLPDLELAPCAGERGPLKIEAYLSRPEAARQGAGGLHVLVNGRPVRDRAIAATVAHAYGSVLERGRYPRGAVYLDLPFELVDVNVHPQKAEVRFADGRAVTDAVYGILSRLLAQAFSLPRGAHAARVAPGSEAPPEPAPSPPEAHPYPERPRAPEPMPLAFRDSAEAPIRPGSEVSWSSLRFVAQLKLTYLLCEGADGVYLLDQHAAAERVTFTRLRHEYQGRAVPSQALLFPVMMEASALECELIQERGREMTEVGLDVRVRGPGTASIHAVPRLLARASPERLVRDLLSEVSRTGQRAFSDAVDLAIATMACHGSVRAGDSLTPSEVESLLKALDHADFAGHCPHGRPVVTFLSWAELERKVGRR